MNKYMTFMMMFLFIVRKISLEVKLSFILKYPLIIHFWFGMFNLIFHKKSAKTLMKLT